ncbi:putative polysaccharide biosynthesis protein [Staphylococcus auricularis]|uniref:putative polysaccharide biosynthesis protein n=1 Tax=Staphylococcus auricularis TaxID=29379 RepID=UPI00242BA2C2|nr:polysaccharide biosynthesis protein [Staphylococcus auricularis]
MSESKALVRGTFLITLSILITKILGVLYVIPFYSIMGNETNLAPFNYAYTPYNIAIAVATAGVPLAASKYVAKYNAIGAYSVSQKLYRSSFIVMTVTGVIGFAILFFLAPTIATFTLAQEGQSQAGAWSVDEVTWIIRIISTVIIFIPLLATWRGVFQGYESMGPTAVSEVTEQIARILFILIGSYLVLYVFDGDILTANGIAVFGAAIGAIAALLTLWYYWRKRKNNIQTMVASDSTGITVGYGKMYKEIISYSIPFVIVSLNFPLFNLVDQFTHNYALGLANVPQALHDGFFSMLNFTTNKIVMIPTSLAAGFAVSLVPFITKTFEEGRLKEMHSQIRVSLGVLMYITVPAALGIMALAYPLYTVFYSANTDGSTLLFYYAPVSILIGLLSVTASMLQGIDKQKLTVFIILSAVVIKVVINVPLIYVLHTPGAVLSTAIALLFANICNLVVIKKHAQFNYSETWMHFAKIFFYGLLMMVIVEGVSFGLEYFLSPASKVGSLIILAIGVLIGVAVYGGLTLKTRLADEFLGDIPDKIRDKLGFLK